MNTRKKKHNKNEWQFVLLEKNLGSTTSFINGLAYRTHIKIYKKNTFTHINI
jgi:hypothetical protein